MVGPWTSMLGAAVRLVKISPFLTTLIGGALAPRRETHEPSLATPQIDWTLFGYVYRFNLSQDFTLA